MNSLSAYLVVLFLITTNLAVEFEVRGTINCMCLYCRSVANVQLWEEDSTDPDDRLDEVVVRQSAFILKFDQSELFGVDPYLVIRHDCSPDLWDEESGQKHKGKEFCFVQKRHDLQPPVDDQLEVRVDLNVGELPEDYKDMEICAPEAEFRRIFGGGPLRGKPKSREEPKIIRGNKNRRPADEPTVLLANSQTHP